MSKRHFQTVRVLIDGKLVPDVTYVETHYVTGKNSNRLVIGFKDKGIVHHFESRNWEAFTDEIVPKIKITTTNNKEIEIELEEIV